MPNPHAEQRVCRYCGDAGRFQILSSVSDHAWADCFCRRPALIDHLEADGGATTVLAAIVRANDEAPDFGMCDQRDNDGEWYQSADLAASLIAARTLIAARVATGEGDDVS